MTRMIRKILIANRGEIACRIIHTCREMGIAAVAVYSDADANALHVELADEALRIGASPAAESYLNQAVIIEAAKRTGADAIHPGFGFLAENAAFAQGVIDAGLIWIGPPPSAIQAMGSKRPARLILMGIPIIPGYSGDDQSDDALIAAAEQIGYPVMVKASAGGGGKGMRQVDAPGDLPAALESARREALNAFGDNTLILERVLTRPRHVEVQLFGDQYGHVIALGERECTIQRRYQKIIEETPSTALTPELREKMFAAAISIGQQLGYYSAGTLEFLLDADRNFYFMEMNTRLQVEHPVTELVTGLDLVRWQILVAEGRPLPRTDVERRGHAIEARVYAEDPSKSFLPVTGSILRWKAPPGVRVDTGIRSGDDVRIHYDPMLAKVIAYGEHREEAIRRLECALGELQLMGIRNNIPFLRRVLMHPNHLTGDITTTFVADHPELLRDDPPLPPVALIAAAIAKRRTSPSSPLSRNPQVTHTSGYWRNNPNRPIRERFTRRGETHEVLLAPRDGAYTVQIGETAYDVQINLGDDAMALTIDGHRQRVTVVGSAHDDWWVHSAQGTYRLRWVSPLPFPGVTQAAEGSLRAPMPGKIISVLVHVGQKVNKGELLLTLEAMKMEHRILAPYDGVVTSIYYADGDTVQEDAILLELSPRDTASPASMHR